MKSNKILGILLLLLYVCIVTALLNDAFIRPYNLQNVLRSSSMFAIIGIGAVLVIVTGGIDLSTGSLIGLVGCTMTMTLESWSEHPPSDNGAFLLFIVGLEMLIVLAAWFLWDVVVKRRNFLTLSCGLKLGISILGIVLIGCSKLVAGTSAAPWLTMVCAVGVALLLSVHLGLLHGLLITQLKLQPFVVTLCGLMCYRGLSRYVTGDETQGLGTAYNDSLRLLAIGKPCTATAVMLFFAVILLIVGLTKIVIGLVSKNESRNRFSGWIMTIVGAVLTIVASSRYWNGWSVNWEGTFATIGGRDFKFFTLELPEAAIDRPAVLMAYALWPMIICFVGLGYWSFSRLLRNGKATAIKMVRHFAPLLVVGVAVGLLFTIKGAIGETTVTLSEMTSAFQFGEPGEDASSRDKFYFGVNLILWKMAGIFLPMALLMAAAIWLGKTWTHESDKFGRALWLMTGFFAVLWLLSKTSIHETIVQTPFFFLLVIGAVAALFLNTTVYGRYLFALGNNEEAAQFSGINTDNMKILAYVLCALCGGIAAVLFTLDSNNVEPSGHGSWAELYAIAAAVLGGCSLRGGEGSILGVIIGATIMRVLYNAPDMIGIASQLEVFTIGSVLLIGVIVDESARRVAANRDRKVVSSS